MVHINWKKTLIILLDILLAVYLGFSMTSFNRPDESHKMCTKVNISIADENTYGFLSAQEIKNILEGKHLYPLAKPLTNMNPRDIEDVLRTSSFVSTAQCYKTQDGQVNILVTQRLPIIRIKSEQGDDYYVDDQGGIMASQKYTSDLIIATGHITRDFARTSLASLAEFLMSNEFWKNQVVQINVLPDLGIELVPRVGDHIVFIGYLPKAKERDDRDRLIRDFVGKKLERLEKFYRYGLSEAGWNRYHYISLEFDNQIICKKEVRKLAPPPQPQRTDSIANTTAAPAAEQAVGNSPTPSVNPPATEQGDNNNNTSSDKPKKQV